MVLELTPQLEQWGIKSNRAKAKYTVVKSAAKRGYREAEKTIQKGIEIDGDIVKETE